MVRAMPLAGCFSPSRSSKFLNFSRSSASSIVSTLVPMIGTPALARARARFSGVWPPNCTITPSGCTRSQMFSTSSVVSGSKNKQVAGVVVGADGLGVRVDHDRLDAHLAQGEAGVAAAVVELDPLADAVRPAAEDHDPLLAGLLGRGFVFVLVGRVVVGRVGLELGGAGIDRLERGHDAPPLALGADVHLGRAPDRGQLPVGEAELLGLAQQRVARLARARRRRAAPPPSRRSPGDCPGTTGRCPSARGSRRSTCRTSARSGGTRPARSSGVASLARTSSRLGCSGVPQRSLPSQPKPKLPTSSPRRAFWNDSLNVRPMAIVSPTLFICVVSVGVGLGELLEGEPRDLGDHVVDRRLEAGLGLAGDVVGQLVQPVADGQLGGDLGDRETRWPSRPGRWSGSPAGSSR